MSRIDEMLLPCDSAGVPHVRLGDLGQRNSGTRITAARMRSLHSPGAPLRIYGGGQTVVDVPEGTIPQADVVRTPSIVVKSRGNIGFDFCDRPFSHKSEMWSYSVSRPDVEIKFVYYFLLTQVNHLQNVARATSVKLPQLSVRDTDALKVPLPPLEIQREIVRILDQFTQLEARRAQFMRVREELLHSADGVVISLGDLADNLDRYRRPIAKAQRASGSIPYYGASGVVDKVDGYIFDDDLLLISEDGANLIARNSPIAFSISGKSWVNNHAHVLRFPNRDVQKFVEFYVNWLDIAQYVSGESQPKLNRSSLDRISIPLPPPCEISRIVSSLGRFEELISGVRASLPAEIAARRKQYEYYRDKLLTFEEKV